MTDTESDLITKYFNLMQKSMDCYLAGDMEGFKKYGKEANDIYLSSIKDMEPVGGSSSESTPEPAEGETVTRTTVTKSKDGLAGDTTPEEKEMLASVTGDGGLSGETTPEEDEMLSHFDNILQGLRGLQ